jgi:hypothetical protein
MRAVASLMGLVLAAATAGGCASSGQPTTAPGMPSRTAVRTLLAAVALGTAGLAVGAALKSEQIEKDLRAESQSRDLTGREFAARDAEGTRWNRIGRASTFVSALAVIGLGITFEMRSGDRIRHTPTPEGPPQVLPPVPPPPSAGAALAPAQAFQRSATAR